MSLKSRWKKLKSLTKVVIGAAILAVGAGGVYSYNEFKYNKNVLRFEHPLGKVMVVGDTGERGHILNKLVSNLDAARPDVVFILGDEKYPDGIQNEREFKEFLEGPFYRPGRLVFFVGGNHTQYAYKNRDFLLRLARSGQYPWFKYLNYYWGVTDGVACYAFQDTAIYDVVIVKDGVDSVRQAQERFIGSEFPQDAACIGKPMYLFQHHGIYAPDAGHGDRGSDRFKKFYLGTIRGRYKLYVNGHSHVTSNEGCDGGTCHYTVGAASKLNTCTRGKNVTCFESPGALEINGAFYKLNVY